MVRLLRLLAEWAAGAKGASPAPFLHWGDLDRPGVLILRSLRRRSGLPIEPLWMDEATYRRHAPLGQPLPAEEREEVRALAAASPGEVGSGLLQAMSDAGRWVEQETVAEEVLGLGGGCPELEE